MRYCLTLDLKNDPQLIKEYEELHQQIWPGIAASIKDAGITNMEIYRFQNRLFMIMETTDDFSFEKNKRWTRRIQKYRSGNKCCGSINRPCPDREKEKNGNS
jgi:L-rhamnose mutarotase